MEPDIEKRIEYEIKCNEIIQQMFIAKPVGPGGDAWDSTTDVHQLPFVDFVKYEDPILTCGCSSQGLGDQLKRSKTRNQCNCWKISNDPITRKGILEMNETLDMHLDKQLAQEQGVCPVRRHLFGSLFDEMIRQEMIISPERGLLLMRVKDELKMSLIAYEALYEQGLNYGMQKRLAAERTINELKAEHGAVLRQTVELKNKIKALHEEFKDQKMQSELSVKAVRNRAKLEVDQLTEIKVALQLNQVVPDIERIEKERRLRNLH